MVGDSDGKDDLIEVLVFVQLLEKIVALSAASIAAEIKHTAQACPTVDKFSHT